MVITTTSLYMTQKMELGLVLEGSDAEEFLKNEADSNFTPKQVELFKKAKRIYRSHRTKFKF